MTRWALTGGAGYLGSALNRALVAQSHEVRQLKGDVRDRAAVGLLVRDAGVVVHLAAFVHKRASSGGQQRECREVNVGGTQVVLDAIAEHRPSALLVFVSSANVYSLAAAAVDETPPLAPRTLYGETKLEAVDLVRRSRAAAVILRPAMVFGPGA